MNALSGAAVASKPDESQPDLETIFSAEYERIAYVVARIIRNPARAEEIAVDVFLKWSRTPQAHGDKAEGWLFKTAVREALDELRRQTRRSRFETPLAFLSLSPTPEDLRSAKERQDRVRAVLSRIQPRQAELLLLRNQGLTYEELASALDLNPSSIGTLLSRAQQAFRKEYVKRYAEE